jgi:hypothetical protein
LIRQSALEAARKNARTRHKVFFSNEKVPDSLDNIVKMPSIAFETVLLRDCF